MDIKFSPRWLGAALLSVILFSAPAAGEEKTLRVGYFPNLTHAQALIAQNMAAEGRGWFEARLPGVTITWHSFNAGPSAMEALSAQAIDLTYVGPNPVLNSYLRAQGGVNVLAGAVRGGAGLVVPVESSRSKPADFKGKRIATPQTGNTQDIACRWWLSQAGLTVTLNGGEVSVVPVANQGILPLFVKRLVDAAWTVEPWISRLEMEAGGKLVYSEPAATSLTTVLAAGAGYLEREAGLVQKFTQAHRELTEWIKQNPKEAQKRVAEELTRQTKSEFPLDLVRHAWPRLIFENKVTDREFEFSFKAAKEAGFIKDEDMDPEGLVAAP